MKSKVNTLFPVRPDGSVRFDPTVRAHSSDLISQLSEIEGFTGVIKMHDVEVGSSYRGNGRNTEGVVRHLRSASLGKVEPTTMEMRHVEGNKYAIEMSSYKWSVNNGKDCPAWTLTADLVYDPKN